MQRTSQARLDELVAAVGGGESIAAACRRLGLSRDTVYAIRRRDRAFAAELAAATDARPRLAVVQGGSGQPLAADEWEQLLSDRCREGSVAALRLWHATHRGEATETDPEAEARYRRLMALVPDGRGRRARGR